MRWYSGSGGGPEVGWQWMGRDPTEMDGERGKTISFTPQEDRAFREKKESLGKKAKRWKRRRKFYLRLSIFLPQVWELKLSFLSFSFGFGRQRGKERVFAWITQSLHYMSMSKSKKRDILIFYSHSSKNKRKTQDFLKWENFLKGEGKPWSNFY